jgi:hypothetical protein
MSLVCTLESMSLHKRFIKPAHYIFTCLLHGIWLFFRRRLYLNSASTLYPLPHPFHFSVQEYFRIFTSNVTFQCSCFVFTRSRVQIYAVRGPLLWGCDLRSWCVDKVCLQRSDVIVLVGSFKTCLVNVNVSKLRCIFISNGNLHTYWIWYAQKWYFCASGNTVLEWLVFLVLKHLSQKWYFCASDNTVFRVTSVFNAETFVSVHLYKNITHTFESKWL